MSSIWLYFQLVKTAICSEMQHKTSFLMTGFALFLSTFVEIAGIWVLFDRFKVVQGWHFQEVALIYGIINTAFAVAECSARGFDTFAEIVRNGDFDRMLLRPCSAAIQVASREIQLMRLGRFAQGLCILIWAFFMFQFSFFSVQTAIVFLSILGAICIFYALFVIQATIAFWSIESLEIMNIFTYGGVEAGQYPMNIYPKGFRLFFTVVIPIACVAYYPVAILLQHKDLPLYMAFFFPLAGVLFLICSLQFWKLGVRRYHSTGS